MGQSQSDSYRKAGVDITAGYEAVRRMAGHVARTKTPGVLSALGGFGGLFAPDLTGMKEPVLVSGTDGVGTKLRLAFVMDRHDTIGIDCVAMCVNDVLCAGAKPLFFLDYIACGTMDPDRVEQIVAGVAEGCVQAGCGLIGGETAEMPGFYPHGDYDIAGFTVGMVDKERMLAPSMVQAGDLLIALPSSGVHSNGFSLVRRVFPFEETPALLEAFKDELGCPLGEALLAPTRIYVAPVLALLEAVPVHGLCHITGGGFYENIPRMLPEGLSAAIDADALTPPPLFGLIQREGGIPTRDMYNTFNMGVGMCAALPQSHAEEALALLRRQGEQPFVLGRVVEGQKEVLM